MSVEDMTISERLKRLRDIADDPEVAHGISNIRREINECIEGDMRDCAHCGSPFTYRRSDGDIACYDCPGIMPEPEVKVCPWCGEQGTESELVHHDCAEVRE